jgi:hypothetical protein
MDSGWRGAVGINLCVERYVRHVLQVKFAFWTSPSKVFVSHALRDLSKELEVNIPVSTGHHRTAVIANSCPLFLPLPLS